MDPYEVLGVPKNASTAEIKSSYRKQAMKFHPDKHTYSPYLVKRKATAKFKQVTEAYEVLMDDRKRASYDYGRGSSSNYRSSRGSTSNSSNSRQGYGYSSNFGGSSGNSRSYTYGKSGGGNFYFKFEFRMPRFGQLFIKLAFASLVLGGPGLIDFARDKLAAMRNRKSIEYEAKADAANKKR